MKSIFIFSTIILTIEALSAKDQWNLFKLNHGKSYKSIFEDQNRFKIFENNLKTIQEHNAKYEKGLESYSMSINQFGDITPEEFAQILRVQAIDKPNFTVTLRNGELSSSEVPESIDWREKGAVLDARNQGACGSCWAFAAAGALEGQNAIINNQTVYLSVQQLIDCSGDFFNRGCKGGRIPYALAYVENNGIVSDKSYPFEEKTSSCKANAENTVLEIDSYVILPPDEDSLKGAVGTIGPVAVTICGDFIQFYHQGIFDGYCNDTLDGLNHAVLVVGYGSEKGKDFWIIKNSWGTNWGENGFIKLIRGVNKCGIIYETTYPIL